MDKEGGVAILHHLQSVSRYAGNRRLLKYDRCFPVLERGSKKCPSLCRDQSSCGISLCHLLVRNWNAYANLPSQLSIHSLMRTASKLLASLHRITYFKIVFHIYTKSTPPLSEVEVEKIGSSCYDRPQALWVWWFNTIGRFWT